MHLKTIQDILPLVEQPSRYLGTEINSIHKDHSQVKLKFLFAFPDLYEIGTSHFGIQILYHILNGEEETVAERVFAPATDMAGYLKANGVPLCALESGRPAREFDIIGFSLLYELNYTNVLAMLDLSGIPFRFSDRGDTHPIIIGGGPCTCNPEPVADFFDALVIGDGEKVILEMTRAWLLWKENEGEEKQHLLRAWSKIAGVYIPSFFSPSFDNHGFQRLTAIDALVPPVTRAIIGNLDRAPFPEKPIIPFAKPIHDRLRLEVGRGCSRGCRFCQAGMIYRPVRERSLNTLLKLSEASLAATGYEDLSLLSLSTSDYSCIGPLLEGLMTRGEADHIAVSFPSFRAGTLTSDLMEMVKKVRKTGFTIAAEAGSQRLRDVINKNIREDDIFSTVEDAFRLGWQVIKLYFMVGLPTETQEDLLALVRLVKALQRISGPKGRKGKINVSVNTFIPKAHTPFQWAQQISLAESRQKIEWLKEELKLARVQIKWQNSESSFLEGLFARGDRRLSGLLEVAYRQGCRFDGWSDHFRFDKWLSAAEEVCLDFNFYTTRSRHFGEPLPWDHLDMGIDKNYFRSEWEKSMTGQLTPDCRWGDCQICGVCDFKSIEPKIFPAQRVPTAVATRKETAEPLYLTYRISYSKQGAARFFGHLEQVNIFLRAFRRAGIPIKYSEGFHPMPKVSFDNPLPLGMESLSESFNITVADRFSPIEVKELVNLELPQGLKIFDVHLALQKKKMPESWVTRYEILMAIGFFEKERELWFNEQSSVILCRPNRKGKIKTVDLKAAVQEMEVLSPQKLALTLQNGIENNVRPIDILSQVFLFDQESIRRARVVKIATIFPSALEKA
ncbi:MAG: TIGR03960 family B12-binding radical SAM protein [Pseudomonadota bacterium]